MAEIQVLKAEARKDTGKKKVARIRSKGQIPAIIYGHKKEPLAIALDTHDFTLKLHHGHRVFDVDVDAAEAHRVGLGLRPVNVHEHVFAGTLAIEPHETVLIEPRVEVHAASERFEAVVGHDH